MKRFIFSALLIVGFIQVISQNVPSPQQFLGYKIGSRYTRHHQIAAYCKMVASVKPDMVKLEKYGETNEGRELLLMYISSPENMQQLDFIKTNNLRLAGLTKDKAAPTTQTPAVIWLSYNVHGNEPASSEAAMLTIDALVNATNEATKSSLKNAVVIIDPCLNPDGRDRYVNWYNSVVGTQYNVDPQSREHIEPWPQGRSNHYNFDLNRDWAWQTQVESKQRIKKYLEWMPQVHVDFHEQGYNEPYYFAPAAEPFHELITPWQRQFQTQIGKNNAKAFDANHWLYFTKERFDLFYPSYGDTYPTYNGAIGMTYEQGGIRGGLGIVNEDGDTLTLADRALHHFTTGMTTIETAASNSQQLITEFKKYFDDCRTGKNTLYKTYILTSDNLAKINNLISVFQRNGIEYGTVTPGVLKGYNYASLKEESINLKKYHIAVSMLQPRSVLANILLEPKSKLTDSNTYDITAWSLPYAHGVDGWALKESLPVKISNVDTKQAAEIPASKYGYLIKYQSINSAKLLAQLLKNGIKVRFAEKPFVVDKNNYDAGTLIVLNNANQSTISKVLSSAVQDLDVEIVPIQTGMMEKGADFGSPDVKFVGAPKVAILTGDQVSSLDAGECWNFFDQVLQYPVTLLNASDIGRIQLKNYQVIIMPDGGYRNLNDKASMDKLRDFVKNGGKLIALQNAVSVLSAADWGIKLKEDKEDEKEKKDEYAALKKYAERERDYLPNSIPGAIYKVDLDNTHPLAFGYGNHYYTLKQDANVYEFLKDGWNVGVVKKDNYISGFSGSKVKAKIKDGLLFGVQEYGSGSVVYLSDNPMFRLFWQDGHLLLCNAVFLVGK